VMIVDDEPSVQKNTGTRHAGDCPAMPIIVDDYDDAYSVSTTSDVDDSGPPPFEGTPAPAHVTSPTSTLLTASENEAGAAFDSDNNEWLLSDVSSRKRRLRKMSRSPPARPWDNEKKTRQSKWDKIPEVYIEVPHGFNKNMYMCIAREPGANVIRDNNSDGYPLPSITSGAGKSRQKNSKRQRVAKKRSPKGKNALASAHIPGAAWLYSYFPPTPEIPETQEAGPSRIVRSSSSNGTRSGVPMKQTSRTRSPSTYQIDIDEELLWQPIESSSDERDEARIEFYLLNDKNHPSCVPVNMAPQGKCGLHPRHMQHFSDWSKENIGGHYSYQNHSLMDEDLKEVFSTMKDRIFRDDAHVIESFMGKKQQNGSRYDKYKSWRGNRKRRRD